MYLLRIADIASGSSFEPSNSMEQKLGYVLESENYLKKKSLTPKRVKAAYLSMPLT